MPKAEFSIYGFKATTTRAIAARGGCSEGLIQNYFSGKEGLLMGVMRAGTANQGELLDEPWGGTRIHPPVRRTARRRPALVRAPAGRREMSYRRYSGHRSAIGSTPQIGCKS